MNNRHQNQKYDVNLEAFEQKASEEFAYLLGFFYADGYNNEKRGQITISLKLADKSILDKFSCLFFGDRPVYERHNKCQTNNHNGVCTLSVVNKSLSRLLAAYGAGQNKTYKIRFPYWLDKSLYRHFIRGYFDGDGSIEKHNRQYRVSIASNWEFNNQIIEIIKNETGIDFGIIRQGSISIAYKGGNKNTKKFLEWLYGDCSIYLQRKFDRYRELLVEQKRVEDTFCHVSFVRNRNYWAFRLPSKYGRKIKGGFKTKEEALSAYKEKLKHLVY